MYRFYYSYKNAIQTEYIAHAFVLSCLWYYMMHVIIMYTRYHLNTSNEIISSASCLIFGKQFLSIFLLVVSNCALVYYYMDFIARTDGSLKTLFNYFVDSMRESLWNNINLTIRNISKLLRWFHLKVQQQFVLCMKRCISFCIKRLVDKRKNL